MSNVSRIAIYVASYVLITACNKNQSQIAISVADAQIEVPLAPTPATLDSSVKIHCFTATAGDNTLDTNEVFRTRKCQGGGVTWAAIIRRLVSQYGQIERSPTEIPNGLVGDVARLRTSNGVVWFSIDDEAEASLFCSQSAEFMAKVSNDYNNVNKSPDLLRKILARIPPLEAECMSF